MKHCNKTFVLQSTLFMVWLEHAAVRKHDNIEHFLVSAELNSQKEATVSRENPVLQQLWAVPPCYHLRLLCKDVITRVALDLDGKEWKELVQLSLWNQTWMSWLTKKNWEEKKLSSFQSNTDCARWYVSSLGGTALAPMSAACNSHPSGPHWQQLPSRRTCSAGK